MYIIYTDGSCDNIKKVGGIGAVIAEPNEQYRELYKGPFYQVTSNMMEMLAAIEGLRMVAAGSRVLIRSDSMYLVRTMTDNWVKRFNGKLWAMLDSECSIRKVDFEWVRGHAGDFYNERADRLALRGAKGK